MKALFAADIWTCHHSRGITYCKIRTMALLYSSIPVLHVSVTVTGFRFLIYKRLFLWIQSQRKDNIFFIFFLQLLLIYYPPLIIFILLPSLIYLGWILFLKQFSEIATLCEEMLYHMENVFHSSTIISVSKHT